MICNEIFSFSFPARGGHRQAPGVPSRDLGGPDPGRAAVPVHAAVAAAVHDRAAQDPAGGRAHVQGQDRLHQHHDGRAAGGDAVREKSDGKCVA